MFANIESIATPDEDTVVLTLKNSNPDLLFQLGQRTALMVEPKSAATNNTQPVGTGPYRLEAWNRGSSVTLARWDGHRNAADVKMRRATIRFINDPAAQAGRSCCRAMSTPSRAWRRRAAWSSSSATSASRG